MTISDLVSHFAHDRAHHAYIVRGGTLADLSPRLREYGSLFVHEQPSLLVDDARMLRQMANRATGERYIIIVAVGHCTNEAQNALLKTLEEPYARTHILLVVPHSCQLLETVQSRCIEVRDTQTANDTSSLKDMPYHLRKKQIDALLKKDDAPKRAMELVDRELQVLHTRGISLDIVRVDWALRHLCLPGMPAKLILEHLIATL
ncbi:MAG: hypothetical protein Q8P93_03680 [bacterium]|nr:hypothetical protein [bacterium]